MTVGDRNGLAAKKDKVKILGRGELKTKLNVKVHAFSASAKAAIEAQGGTVEVVGNAPAAEGSKEK